MIRPAFRQALLSRTLRALRLIWIGLGISVLMYVAIGVWMTRTMQPHAASDVIATLAPALYAIAVALALLTVWWRRRFLAPERVVVDAMAASPQPTMNPAPESDEERRALAVMTRLQAQSVAVGALSESPAVFGLVLSILSGDARHVTGLAAATLVLLAMHAPSRARLEAALAAIPQR